MRVSVGPLSCLSNSSVKAYRTVCAMVCCYHFKHNISFIVSVKTQQLLYDLFIKNDYIDRNM